MAHSIELVLKAHLLRVGRKRAELENIGHNLERAFDELEVSSSGLCSDTEAFVRNRWKFFLRDARDRIRNRFIAQGISDPEFLVDLGVRSNEAIGSELPSFQTDLKWLSDRHASKGGQFRYFLGGHDTRLHIHAFGLDEHTVPRTVMWAAEFLIRN